MTTLDKLLSIAGLRSLMSLLRAFFRGQRDSALQAILQNRPIDLRPWIVPMSEAAREPLKQAANQGIRQILRSRILPPKPPLIVVAVPQPPRPLLESSFAMKQPSVDEFVRTMSINFAESTNATSEHHTEVAREMFRRELRAGLDRGEAQDGLYKRINRIYRNPERARLIAQTECLRALNGGQYLEIKSRGISYLKSWLESSDACDECVRYGAMGDIPLDQPYASKPGPYGVVQFPPAHPNCFCTQGYEPA